MTLSLQFFVLSALPASFLALFGYTWWRGGTGMRQQAVYRWGFTLLATAVWSSGILRFYVDDPFSAHFIFYWGKVATYAFSLAAGGALLTTQRYLRTPSRPAQVAVALGAVLWLLAALLDPLFWPPQLPFALLPGQPLRHFDLWAAVWVASWALPLLAAWLLTAQINRALPTSLYRNQARYWLLTLALFGLGGVLTSIRQPGQPLWQEISALTVILAALVGTISLTHRQLPDLQIAARQLVYRLAGATAVFLLIWFALALILSGLRNLPPGADLNLILILLAAAVAALLVAVYSLTNRLARRLVLPAATGREQAMADYHQAVGYFPEVESVSLLFLRLAQATVGSDDAWLFLADDGPGGVLLLRPVATLTGQAVATAEFAAESPFSRHLRQQNEPLIQYDLELVERPDPLSEAEQATLAQWGRMLYAPLRSGDNLAGMLALGRKQSGEPYDQEDYAALMALCAQASPLLAQAQQLANLRQISGHSFRQNRQLAWQNRQLQQLLTLYEGCLNLISPELKRPFPPALATLQKLQKQTAGNATESLVVNLSQEMSALSQPLDNLINLVVRVRRQRPLRPERVQLADVAQNAIRALHPLAETRQVQVAYHEPDASLPETLADPEQLQEAVQYVLHNAIKFNKIGGQVHLYSGSEGSDLYLQIADTGVGIPEERLGALWDGLDRLTLNGSSARRLGVGLVLAQYIVAAHGGRMSVSSRYGAGSVFTIYLPLVYLE